MNSKTAMTTTTTMNKTSIYLASLCGVVVLLAVITGGFQLPRTAYNPQPVAISPTKLSAETRLEEARARREKLRQQAQYEFDNNGFISPEQKREMAALANPEPPTYMHIDLGKISIEKK